jgi:hypothetical protein
MFVCGWREKTLAFYEKKGILFLVFRQKISFCLPLEKSLQTPIVVLGKYFKNVLSIYWTFMILFSFQEAMTKDVLARTIAHPNALARARL